MASRNCKLLRCVDNCLLGVIFLFLTCPARAGFLFRASPGYAGIKPAGLWGGLLEHHENGSSKDLFSIGYEEIDMPTSSYAYEGIHINTMSYDPHSRQVLVEVTDMQDHIQLIGKGNICPIYGPLIWEDEVNTNIPLTTIIPDVKLVDPDHPFMFDSQCGWKCGWGSFAFFREKIYFILTGVHGLRSSELRRKIQIRVLNSNCDNLLATAIKYGHVDTEFHVLNCSDLVKTVLDEPYSRFNANLDTWVGSPLKIVENPSTGHQCFYLQLTKKAHCDVTMTLVQLCTDSLEPVNVHIATVPSIYGGNSKIRGFGSIDYRDGMLCWTAAEELLCGPIAGDEVTLVSVVLPPGAAFKAGICTGDLPLANVITGVTVAEAAPLRVYFGCYSGLAGYGGTGLVEINLSASTEIVKNIFKVTSNGRKVYATSLFYIDSLCGPCQRPGCMPQTTTKYVSMSLPHSGVTASTRWMDGGAVDGALTGSAYWTMAASFFTFSSLLANKMFTMFISVCA